MTKEIVGYSVIVALLCLCLWGCFGIIYQSLRGKKAEVRNLIFAEISLLLFAGSIYLTIPANRLTTRLGNLEQDAVTAGTFLCGLYGLWLAMRTGEADNGGEAESAARGETNG